MRGDSESHDNGRGGQEKFVFGFEFSQAVAALASDTDKAFGQN
jgi:hypothetical protein